MTRLPRRPTARPFDRLSARLAVVGFGRIATAAIVTVGLVATASWAMRSPETPPSADDPSSATVAPVFTLVPPVSTEPVVHVVHVVGAVVRPGVYRLEAGARVVDAVDIAGGPRADAVLEAINLATVIADGQRIHVPSVDDPPSSAAGVVGPGSGGSDLGAMSTAATDINTADADRLVLLPGVGPALAAAIIRHRERHGPFAAVDDLVAVSGIGPAKLEILRPLVTVG